MTEKKFGLSSFILHILAMAFMLLDHIYWSGLVDFTWFTCVGRLAFPIFAFMIAEGFHYTKSRKKYMLRLLIFAVITEIPFNLVAGGSIFYIGHQNVLWTFLLSVILLWLYEKIRLEKSSVFRFFAYPIITLVVMVIAVLGMTDYNAIGVATVILFHFTRADENTSPRKRIFFFIVQLLAVCYLNVIVTGTPDYSVNLFGTYFSIQSFAVFALPVIWFYNGKQGYYNKYIKWSYYLFYPVHCLVLGILALVF